MDLRAKPTTYKIGQAARIVGVKTFVLRFWETEFPQLVPCRTAKGQRYYEDSHLELIRRIKHLLYEEGLTIEGARRRLSEDGRATFLREVAVELAALRLLLGGETREVDEKPGSAPQG